MLQNWVLIQLIVTPHILEKVQGQRKEVCRLIEPCLIIGTREYKKTVRCGVVGRGHRLLSQTTNTNLDCELWICYKPIVFINSQIWVDQPQPLPPSPHCSSPCLLQRARGRSGLPPYCSRISSFYLSSSHSGTIQKLWFLKVGPKVLIKVTSFVLK